MLELVGAYAPFANGGNGVMPHVIEKITDTKGKLLYSRSAPDIGRIIDAREVGMMNAMMAETLTIGTAHKAALPGWPAAGKTGTSQDFRDAWFIGYTAHLVTGVWLGNDDGTPTRKVTGGSLPVEIWSRFMRAAHQGVPVENLPGEPGGDFLSGVFSGNQRAPNGNMPTASADPVPPARVPSASTQQTTGSGGLDGWLLNNLFGRR
jgi:penicillin-binding protein 1A